MTMLQSSRCILSPTSPSLFAPDLPYTSFMPSKRTITSRRSPRFSKLNVLSKQHQQSSIDSASHNKDGSPSAEQFLQNNSIADFMRFKHHSNVGERLAELQTAVVSYRKRFPWSILQPFLRVDLVSTIHIADKEYFATLQRELETYDCVLYEMVASRESLESKGNLVVKKNLKSLKNRGFNFLGFIQRQMARVLTVDFQLDCLDYHSKNWYHADLDFETFKLLQQQKGESFFTFARDMTIKSTQAVVQSASIPDDLGLWKSQLLWASRVLPMPLIGVFIISGVCLDMASQASQYPELEALSRLDFGAAIKLFLAKQLTSEFTQATADVEAKSVVIGERNKAATEALRRAIDDGHSKIAILYGGGHMPDLGRRLRAEFDLSPSQVQWITAWSIGASNTTSRSSFPFLKTVAEVLRWPINRYQTLALLIFSSVLALDLLLWELLFGTTANWITRLAFDTFQ
ncbi:unnamed protein product [Cuscuta europaea]|uniref:Uncharacterized protein n=1 Tax=Cuscuta europaea TaxID=41803 RepID=A0A9P0YYQ7_CUSEU|nr:unnamed protein product [Cuscuta europaea]